MFYRHFSAGPFSIRAFLRNELHRCRVIVRLLSGYGGQRARVGLGWPPPGPLGQAVPPLLLNTSAKNLYEQKTRGGAGGIFVFRFVAAVGPPFEAARGDEIA